MATLVQSSSGGNYPTSLTFPSNPTAGNLLVVAIAVTQNQTTNGQSISGWTTVSAAGGLFVAAKTSVGAADKTVAVNTVSGGDAAVIMEVSGATLSGFAVTATTSNSSSRTANTNDFVVGIVQHNNFNVVSSANPIPTENVITGMTKLRDGTFYWVDPTGNAPDIGFAGTVDYALPSTTTTYNAGTGTTATVASSGGWGGTWSISSTLVAVFQAVDSGGTSGIGWGYTV